jgi:membrane protein
MKTEKPRRETARLAGEQGGWGAVAASSWRQVKYNRVNLAAGAFAYRWFLAIFPLIIAPLGVASLVSLPRHVVVSLIHGFGDALPSGAAQVFTTAITHTSGGTGGDWAATVTASVVALWSALSGMVIVEEGLDMAFGLARDRTFLAKRLAAFPLLLGGVVLGSGASALVVFGGPIGRSLRPSVPFAGDAFVLLWTVSRWVVALALINLLFSLLYSLAPNWPKVSWRWSSVGSFVATFIWAVVSLGFSLYATDFSSYGRTYGAFAGVAILVFWLYLTGLAILIGGEVDAALGRLRAGATTTSTPDAGGHEAPTRPVP